MRARTAAFAASLILASAISDSGVPRRRRLGIVKSADRDFAKKKARRQFARASRQLNRRRAS